MLFARLRSTPGTDGEQTLAAKTRTVAAGRLSCASPGQRKAGSQAATPPSSAPQRRVRLPWSLRSSAPAFFKAVAGAAVTWDKFLESSWKAASAAVGRGALGERARAGGGEQWRRVGLGIRAHSSLRGQTFNSCQVSPPPRLAVPWASLEA